MANLNRRFTLALAALLFGTAPAEVAAQVNDASPLMVKHRNDCRLAAQVLTTGVLQTKRDWAREYISACAQEGPLAIVQEWRTLPGDSAAVLDHMCASTRIHDQRIYDWVRTVTQDRSRAEVVRVGAMYVLDNYVDRHHAGWFGCVPPAGSTSRKVLPRRGLQIHARYSDGPVPFTGPVREPVLRLLQEIGASRDMEPMAVWYTAAALAVRIQQEIEWGK